MNEIMQVKPHAEFQEFLVIYNRLCVALREQQDETGTTQNVYFDAIKDIPIKSLEDGAGALARERGRKFFPTTAEWRTAALQAQEQVFRATTQPARVHPWVNECEACEDTGWVYHDCLGDSNQTCGRKQPHRPHPYVVVCTCRPNNRTYQRHATFGRGA